MFILPTKLFFLEFQIDHYKGRVENSRTIDELIFNKKTLYELQQSLSNL